MSNDNGSSSCVWTEKEPGAVYSLFDAIGKASAEFPPLPRTATGQLQNRKFQYSPYHKVVECIKQPLFKHGVGFLQAVHTDTDGMVSLSLIVTGHGAAIYAKMQFPRDSDIKVFGAELTYNRRYQLTAFFGLEGDPDADDYETPEVRELPKQVTQLVSKPSEAKVDRPAAAAAAKPETAEPPKPAASSPVETKPSPEPSKTAAMKADKRPISEKLNDAKKQLNWEFNQFDEFCKQHPENFPDFVSVTKLDIKGKTALYELLVSEGKVVPL